MSFTHVIPPTRSVVVAMWTDWSGINAACVPLLSRPGIAICDGAMVACLFAQRWPAVTT